MYSKPEMDRQLFQPSLLQTVIFVLYACAMFLLPLNTLWYLTSRSGWERNCGLLLAAPLIYVSASGLFLLATVGHEGFHGNLSTRPLLSCGIACVFSAAMPLFAVVGYFVCHWQHHRFTNTRPDPDWCHFRRFRLPLARLLLARPLIGTRYLLTTLGIAWRKPPPAVGLPVAPAAAQMLARLNLVAMLAWLGLYGVLAWHLAGMIWPLSLVLLGAFSISGLNAYQEHAFRTRRYKYMIDRGDSLQCRPLARTRTAWLATLLQAGSNFHVEHHLYPHIPCWRLPAVHRRLRELGWYAGKGEWVDNRFFSGFGMAASSYSYGD